MACMVRIGSGDSMNSFVLWDNIANLEIETSLRSEIWVRRYEANVET